MALADGSTPASPCHDHLDPHHLPYRACCRASILHGVAAVVAFTLLVAACFVLARRFVAGRQRRWMWYSIATGVVAYPLSAWPGEGASVALFVASAVGWAWLTALAVRPRTELATTAK